MVKEKYIGKKITAKRSGSDYLEDLSDYEKVKENLIARLNNYGENKTRMHSVVKYVIGDMAIVLYLIVREEQGEYIAIKVEKSLFERWKVSEEEVLRTAILNSNMIYEPRVFDITTYIGEKDTGGEFMVSCYDFMLKKIKMGNVITNDKKYNGAIAFFYPGVRERIANMIKGDYYIIFTSIHEAVIYAKSEMNLQFMKRKIENINKNALPAEIVSHMVYCYDRERKILIKE